MYLTKLTFVSIQGLSGSKILKDNHKFTYYFFYVDLSSFDRQACGRVIEGQAIVSKQHYTSVSLLKTKNNSKTNDKSGIVDILFIT